MATVDYNYHGNPPSPGKSAAPVQHAGNSDFVTGETGVWGFSALTVGLNAQFYRAAFPGHPYQVAINRGVRIYHDQTTRPLNDMRWETLLLLAHGAFVTMIDKTAYDGGLDPVPIADRQSCAKCGQTRTSASHPCEVDLFAAHARLGGARESGRVFSVVPRGAQGLCPGAYSVRSPAG
jgi:hypothetical protein